MNTPDPIEHIVREAFEPEIKRQIEKLRAMVDRFAAERHVGPHHVTISALEVSNSKVHCKLEPCKSTPTTPIARTSPGSTS